MAGTINNAIQRHARLSHKHGTPTPPHLVDMPAPSCHHNPRRPVNGTGDNLTLWSENV